MQLKANYMKHAAFYIQKPERVLQGIDNWLKQAT